MMEKINRSLRIDRKVFFRKYSSNLLEKKINGDWIIMFFSGDDTLVS
jgi:hypothetical protein